MGSSWRSAHIHWRRRRPSSLSWPGGESRRRTRTGTGLRSPPIALPANQREVSVQGSHPPRAHITAFPKGKWACLCLTDSLRSPFHSSGTQAKSFLDPRSQEIWAQAPTQGHHAHQPPPSFSWQLFLVEIPLWSRGKGFPPSSWQHWGYGHGGHPSGPSPWRPDRHQREGH